MLVVAITLTILHLFINYNFNKNLTLFCLGHRWQKPSNITTLILIAISILVGISIYISGLGIIALIAWLLFMQFVPAWISISVAYNISRSESAVLALNAKTDSERAFHTRMAIATDDELKQYVLQFYNHNPYR